MTASSAKAVIPIPPPECYKFRMKTHLVSAVLLLSCPMLSAQDSGSSCTVVAYRPWVSAGGSIRLGVLVDGKKLTNLKGGTHEELILSCGRHLLSLTHFEGLQVPVDLSAEAVTYVRAERPWGYVKTADIRVATQDQAQAEISVADGKR